MRVRSPSPLRAAGAIRQRSGLLTRWFRVRLPGGPLEVAHVIRQFVAWMSGWIVTLDIMINDRELYRELTRPLDMSDFGEVNPPG